MNLFAHATEVKRASTNISAAALVALDRTARVVQESQRYRAAVDRQKRRQAARRFNSHFDE